MYSMHKKQWCVHKSHLKFPCSMHSIYWMPAFVFLLPTSVSRINFYWGLLQWRPCCKYLNASNFSSIFNLIFVGLCDHGLALRNSDGRATKCTNTPCPRGYNCLTRFNVSICCPTNGNDHKLLPFRFLRKYLHATIASRITMRRSATADWILLWCTI